jgi:predicted ATPase
MKDNSLRLDNINLKGFKSIDSNGVDIPFGDITVLLGANGVGKSNVISFFQMLHAMMRYELKNFVGKNGSANSLLHFGAKRTQQIEFNLSFSDLINNYNYKVGLSHAATDSLVFTENTVTKYNSNESNVKLDTGEKESRLYDYPKISEHPFLKKTAAFLQNLQIFQFQDTSQEAYIRNSAYIYDGDFLRSKGGNLAAFLFTLKNHTVDGEQYYKRIIRYIKMILPQFKDFVLSPIDEYNIILRWQEEGSDYIFGPHQLSDGSLRFIALATLLLQPKNSQPSVIVIDEPELGLHPSAISLLAGMIKTASQNCQIILATQSTSLIDEFDVDDIVIVERNEKEKSSTFKKLDQEKLADWLDRYSLSEIWEKNIIGGKP